MWFLLTNYPFLEEKCYLCQNKTPPIFKKMGAEMVEIFFVTTSLFMTLIIGNVLFDNKFHCFLMIYEKLLWFWPCLVEYAKITVWNSNIWNFVAK